MYRIKYDQENMDGLIKTNVEKSVHRIGDKVYGDEVNFGLTLFISVSRKQHTAIIQIKYQMKSTGVRPNHGDKIRIPKLVIHA